MLKRYILTLICFTFSVSAFAQTINVENADFAEDTDYYWTAENTYILDDLVFIKPGSRLFIEPGTLIKGGPGQGTSATGLVITRGAQIFAEGTPSNPIIFTAAADQRDGTANSELRGLWGGVVVLGNATTNNTTTRLIEGVDLIANPQSLAEYGGDNDADNSGVIRYVSIRHSGISVGDTDGNEIQGLTLGGVGSGTTIEYVESFASRDDGFEFFGGTVNTKYLVSAFNSDDAFDWDEGFRGKGQFWFAIQDNGGPAGFGRAAEQDGAIGDENTTPFAHPILSNVTYLGAGQTPGANAGDGAQLMLFRDNTGGEYYNSIFSDHNALAVTIEGSGKVAGFDAKTRLAEGDLVLQNNLWWGFGAGNTIAEFAADAGDDDQSHTRAYLSNAANGNSIGDPEFDGIGRTDGGAALNPVPASDGPAYTMDKKDLDDSFFSKVAYVGAFGQDNWLQGWTALEEHGYLKTPATKTDVNVANADFVEDTDYFWTSDKVYTLTDLVFIKSGSRLFIEPGTLIKGGPGQGTSATGLVITRGAQIFAEGTPSNPIIFTAAADQRDGTANSELRGLWGGVVVLGNATTNNTTTRLIEGVDLIANPQSLAEYGGDNDADNSGVIRYVSIRHSGISVGDTDGNEIQGLTLGGVGSGTTIEYVESFASRDDGFEFFGGTVNTKYLVSAFNSDDAFDWDEGFRGKGQFWFAIQDNGGPAGFGRAAEQDGAIGDENTTPFAHPILSNVTYLGAGQTPGANAGDGAQLMLFRDNTGGEYYNSIFSDHNALAVTIEGSGKVAGFDAKTRLAEGDLVLQNNLWWGFGAGNTIAEFAADAGDDDQSHTRAYLSNAANGNSIGDPEFNGIDRSDGGMALDPRPNLNAAAYKMSLKDLSADAFFTNTSYAGAFGASLWLRGWTALEEHGYLSDGGVINSVEDIESELPSEISLSQNYPNPFNPTTNIEFSLPATQRVTLKVYNMLGQEVATLLNNEQVTAGLKTISFDASSLASGIYLYRLTGQNTSLIRKMTLIK